MSDLSLQLQQAHSQLPVDSYFDPALFKRELDTLFRKGPLYVGHAASVPEVGDFYALPQENEGRALVRTEQGVILVSNVCRHRQAVMLKGKGNLKDPQLGMGGNIVCPLHRWTYSQQGRSWVRRTLHKTPASTSKPTPCRNGTACSLKTTVATSQPTSPT